MSKIGIGNIEAREKLTAKLFWKLVSESGYNDSGSVREYADASTRSLVVRSASKDGLKTVTDEQADVCHEAWTFMIDERVEQQERLIRLARLLTDQSQAATEGTTASIENVSKGCWFEIGSYNIANVRVTGNLSGVRTEGDDYEIDSENGRIKIVSSGAIGNGENLVILFDQPSLTIQRTESQVAPVFRCNLIFEEYNQFHKLWLRRLTMTAYLSVTEFPAQTGEFGTYRVKATADGPVTIEKRPPAAEVLPFEDNGAPGNSSSSSFSSSSSTSVSSSSSSTSQSSYSSASSSSSYSSSSHSRSSSSSPSSNSSSSSSSTAASETSSSSSTELQPSSVESAAGTSSGP